MTRKLHPCASTNATLRREIQQSSETNKAVAARLGLNLKTVAKWRSRTATSDARKGPRLKKVTSVMFGGPNLDILFVTSMAKPPLPRFPSDGVLRGNLFAIRDLGIRGVPEPRFAG